MEEISLETHALYEFMRVDFDAALAKTTPDHSEATVTALAKLDSKLDLLVQMFPCGRLTQRIQPKPVLRLFACLNVL
ncbi:hypothetical protein D1007_53461 [Hordeum vulgare]|nr:hypothetical protein D1007_53461 [Hordeum vulgare]